jgi:CelD/BcsL family acetyltransferase involved in cellulose biosynthesis
VGEAGGIAIQVVSGLDDLPQAALALFGQDAFSTPGWYRSTIAHALPPGAQACFYLALRGGDILAVLPMLRNRRRLAALTTPYTCFWQPLLAPGLDEACLAETGRALARAWRPFPVVRLEAMDGDAAWLPPLLAGLRAGGLVGLSFDHFGNWHVRVAGMDWRTYRDSRPGLLRSAIMRPTRKLMGRLGATYRLISGEDGLEEAIAAYEAVYARSWKTAEAFPRFVASHMRACAADGTLRLGVMYLDGAPIAAQFWLLHGSWACVAKLAHDEKYKRLGPGTVLSGLILRHLLEVDRVTELDFGRGDDDYKQLWMPRRRQRIGVLLCNPWRIRGIAEIARHRLGRWRRVRLRGRWVSLGARAVAYALR